MGGFLGAAVLSAGLMFAPIEQMAEYAHLLSDWQAIAAVFVISMLFSLLPDIDTKSRGQSIFFWTAFLLDVLLIWQGYLQAAAYLGLIAMLPLLTKHRGWTHSKWAMFVVPLPIVAVPYLYSDSMLPISLVYYAAAVSGYFSHLLFDGLIWKRFRVRN